MVLHHGITMALQWYYIKNADSPVPGPTRDIPWRRQVALLSHRLLDLFDLPRQRVLQGLGLRFAAGTHGKARLGWESDNPSWVRHETHGESIIAPCFVSVNKNRPQRVPKWDNGWSSMGIAWWTSRVQALGHQGLQ